MFLCISRWLIGATHIFFLISCALGASQALGVRVKRTLHPKDSLTNIWPLPAEFTFGEETLSVDPALSLTMGGNGGDSAIVRDAFDRYKGIIFKRSDKFGFLGKLRERISVYDIGKLRITVHSESEELQLEVDESYTLLVSKSGEVTIEMRGINVMAEVDVPGHAESWGTGYPELWPSPSCREPLDVSKEFTFDVISGILSDMRKIFPFELFHLGGDEVNTDCWSNTSHVKKWLQNHNMTAKDAYQYFVLRAQEIAFLKNWTPVNWEETFNAFPTKLHPQTVVHNWLGSGVCPKAVAKGFRCIFSNQGVWYLHHLDVPWEVVYTAEPLEGIHKASEQKLVLGGEVCMWGETADASDVQQTIWPRAAAAAERLWSQKDSSSTGNITLTTALPRLQHFRCLLNRRGVPAAPVTNYFARTAPIGPGSCYDQ